MLMENVMERALSEEKHYCANEDYIVREIAGETILVPTGASAEHFNGMLTMRLRGFCGNCFGCRIRLRKRWQPRRNDMRTITSLWNRIFMIL